MGRKELSAKVFKIIKRDFGNEIHEKEIWKRIAETSDDELYMFWIERDEEMIKRVVESAYDGWLTVFYKTKTVSYEGKGLCPKQVLKWIHDNGTEVQDCFYYEVR